MSCPQVPCITSPPPSVQGMLSSLSALVLWPGASFALRRPFEQPQGQHHLGICSLGHAIYRILSWLKALGMYMLSCRV